MADDRKSLEIRRPKAKTKILARLPGGGNQEETEKEKATVYYPRPQCMVEPLEGFEEESCQSRLGGGEGREPLYVVGWQLDRQSASQTRTQISSSRELLERGSISGDSRGRK